MIWTAFAILATLVTILYAWVWQLSACYSQLSSRVWKDEAPPMPEPPAPTSVPEKWSVDLKPKKKRTYRSRTRPARKTKKERE